MEYGKLYDFCLDWQMGMVSRVELVKQFKGLECSFQEFKLQAKKYNWFVNSMNELQTVNTKNRKYLKH